MHKQSIEDCSRIGYALQDLHTWCRTCTSDEARHSEKAIRRVPSLAKLSETHLHTHLEKQARDSNFNLVETQGSTALKPGHFQVHAPGTWKLWAHAMIYHRSADSNE